MEILYIADGRSPIALNWIRYFVDQGHRVHLVSLFPCQVTLDLASLTVIPVAFSGAVPQASDAAHPGGNLKGKIIQKLASPALRTWLRHRLVPRSLPGAALQLRTLITSLQPDLVHAMRIPYEGMLAALAYETLPEARPPLLVSVWGNDFTLHAPASRRLTDLTHLVLNQAGALHTDCERDLRLAVAWGFDPDKPAVVLPGAGGIQLDIFYPGETDRAPVVINPRGLRVYVRNDTFFQAIPLVLTRLPETRFVCPAMAGQSEAEKWVDKLEIRRAVDLLAKQTRVEMAALFRRARVVVSPSTHDGTPNTLLEAMACGCIPVAGDIESIREWITPGVNGLLVDPADPQALAEAICEGIEEPALRQRALAINQVMILDRAEYQTVMGEAASFYTQLTRQ